MTCSLLPLQSFHAFVIVKNIQCTVTLLFQNCRWTHFILILPHIHFSSRKAQEKARDLNVLLLGCPHTFVTILCIPFYSTLFLLITFSLSLSPPPNKFLLRVSSTLGRALAVSHRVWHSLSQLQVNKSLDVLLSVSHNSFLLLLPVCGQTKTKQHPMNNSTTINAFNHCQRQSEHLKSEQ